MCYNVSFVLHIANIAFDDKFARCRCLFVLLFCDFVDHIVFIVLVVVLNNIVLFVHDNSLFSIKC